MDIKQANIRNFVITAHIDHGKSTLADRFLELTATVEVRKMHPQYLDQMGLEQERGITIKMQPVRMLWQSQHTETLNPKPETLNKSKTQNSNNQNAGLEIRNSDLEIADSKQYVLNLIDTPGHVDFSYEVSRALAAVEGAVLLVDATKGVQAQTVANLELARAQGLTIIPVVNKIDLSQARVEETRSEIAAVLKIAPDRVLEVSAKEGKGVNELLETIIREIPPPAGNASAPFRALVFDFQYDDFRGVIAHVRIVDGAIRARERVHFAAANTTVEILEVGTFHPHRVAKQELATGAIGYIVTGIKDTSVVRIGDTVVREGGAGRAAPLPGYREPHPVVYAGLFPENADDFEPLRDALGKLCLNDAALTTFPEESHALGRGFRCGFLGALHLEIVVERLRREFNLPLVVTHPSVAMVAVLQDGSEVRIKTPRDFPAQHRVVREPWIRLEMLVPPEELSSALRVIGETRGTVEETKTVTSSRLAVSVTAPLLDVIEDFADRLKSATRGYASYSVHPLGDRDGDLVRLRCFVAHEEIEALSQIVPRIRTESVARKLAQRLKEALPAQLFSVAIQIGVEERIIARETITALRKDVTAKLYGGDFSRKKKLLVKQRKGKKRLEKTGRVKIPPETFLEILRNTK